MKANKIPLSKIPNDQEFYCGTIFREYGVCIPNVNNEEEDYYDYMLIDINDSTKMLLANVSSRAGNGKAGYTLGYVIKLTNVNRYVVIGMEMKKYFDGFDVYWIDE